MSPTGKGRTRLEFVHRGWPVNAAARRADYDPGWQVLLHDDFAGYIAGTAAKA